MPRLLLDPVAYQRLHGPGPPPSIDSGEFFIKRKKKKKKGKAEAQEQDMSLYRKTLEKGNDTFQIGEWKKHLSSKEIKKETTDSKAKLDLVPTEERTESITRQSVMGQRQEDIKTYSKAHPVLPTSQDDSKTDSNGQPSLGKRQKNVEITLEVPEAEARSDSTERVKIQTADNLKVEKTQSKIKQKKTMASKETKESLDKNTKKKETGEKDTLEKIPLTGRILPENSKDETTLDSTEWARVQSIEKINVKVEETKPKKRKPVKVTKKTKELLDKESSEKDILEKISLTDRIPLQDKKSEATLDSTDWIGVQSLENINVKVEETKPKKRKPVNLTKKTKELLDKESSEKDILEKISLTDRIPLQDKRSEATLDSTDWVGVESLEKSNVKTSRIIKKKPVKVIKETKKSLDKPYPEKVHTEKDKLDRPLPTGRTPLQDSKSELSLDQTGRVIIQSKEKNKVKEEQPKNKNIKPTEVKKEIKKPIVRSISEKRTKENESAYRNYPTTKMSTSRDQILMYSLDNNSMDRTTVRFRKPIAHYKTYDDDFVPIRFKAFDKRSLEDHTKFNMEEPKTRTKTRKKKTRRKLDKSTPTDKYIFKNSMHKYNTRMSHLLNDKIKTSGEDLIKINVDYNGYSQPKKEHHKKFKFTSCCGNLIYWLLELIKACCIWITHCFQVVWNKSPLTH